MKKTRNTKGMLKAQLVIGLILEETLTACESKPLEVTDISVHPDPVIGQTATLRVEIMSVDGRRCHHQHHIARWGEVDERRFRVERLANCQSASSPRTRIMCPLRRRMGALLTYLPQIYPTSRYGIPKYFILLPVQTQ